MKRPQDILRWKEEIAAFARKVEEFTGNQITAENLGQAIHIINEKRKALQRVYDCRKSKCLPISGRDALLMTQISFFDDPERCAQMCNRLADELEQRIKDGVSVVKEGTKRTLDEQFMALSERYMKTNCACFTPNQGRIEDILRLVKEYQADGVIDCSLKFCCLYDTEKYSVTRALKEAGIPVLSLETDYTDSDAGQLRTRISAFIEMLGAE